MIKDRSTFRLFIILIILITFSLVRMTYFDWLLSPRKFLLNSWRWLNLLDASNMPWIQWYTATNIQLQPPFPGGGAQELLFLTRENSTKWSRWGIGLGDTYTITFWGIFELVVKESGGERSDGKKKKASLPARALLSFPSSPRFSLVPWFPLSLGKACGGSSFVGSPDLSVHFRTCDWGYARRMWVKQCSQPPRENCMTQPERLRRRPDQTGM